MILKYSELTRLEMEQINKEETIVLIPLGALEQHGNQAPLGTDDIIALNDDGRLLEHGPRNGDALPLSAGEAVPGITGHGIIALL